MGTIIRKNGNNFSVFIVSGAKEKKTAYTGCYEECMKMHLAFERLECIFGYVFSGLSAEGKLAENYRISESGNFLLWDVMPGKITGYTRQVSLCDGESRTRGFGRGCCWTEWA